MIHFFASQTRRGMVVHVWGLERFSEKMWSQFINYFSLRDRDYVILFLKIISSIGILFNQKIYINSN